MSASPDPDGVLRSSKGRDNFQRMARMLICGGTVLLREVFDTRCPPSNLPTTLQNPATVKLLKAAKLTKPQWDCLYPSPGVYGKSTDFDITLLFRLLRTICSLTPPTAGWDCLPAGTDHSFEADLARIKYYRNLVYGHVNENMEITDDEFLVFWREISEALVRIAGQFSPSKATEWQNAIDAFLEDPLTVEDKRHEQELQRWYQNDTEVKEIIESSMKHLQKEIEYLGQEVRDEAQCIRDHLGGEVKTTTQEVQRLGQEVREEALSIKHQLGEKVESTAQEVQRLSQVVGDEAQGIKDQLKMCGRRNSSAGVKIRMQIDCETIPDPRRETSGTVTIATQGTQAGDKELAVTGTSGRTALDTQDTQAGRLEKVVTGVKRKAEEPPASAGLQLAGKTEGVEEAGVKSDVVPNAQEVMNFIGLKYFKVVDPTKQEELNGFLKYMTDVRKVLVLDAQTGSLILTVLCTSLEILDALWHDYCTGHLNDMAQKYLVTKDVLKEFDLTELKLTTAIQKEDYMAARKFFVQGSDHGMTSSSSISIGPESTSCEKLHSITLGTLKKVSIGLPESGLQNSKGVPDDIRDFKGELEGALRPKTFSRLSQEIGKIFIETQAGNTITLDGANSLDTIEQVKSRIHDIKGISPEQQRLIYDGKQLEDECTLGDYNVTKGARLYLRVRHPEGMQIIARMLNGRSIFFEVKPSDPVKILRKKIQEIEGIPPDELRLIHNDQQLDDKCTLGDYNVKQYSTVDVCSRLRGGGRPIFVKMQNGRRVAVGVSPEDTITDLKEEIKAMIGTPVNKQLITFGDTKLEGDKKLKDFGVEYGSTVLLITRSDTHKKCIVL